MICQLCGCDIGYPERLWLDDGGPLCGECGQDVRETNIKRNRERERRENMAAQTRIAYHRSAAENTTFKVVLDSSNEFPCYWASLTINTDQEIVFFASDGQTTRSILTELRDEINRTLGEDQECTMTKEKRKLRKTEQQWAEDQSQCHDHVAGRQGEGR